MRDGFRAPRMSSPSVVSAAPSVWLASLCCILPRMMILRALTINPTGSRGPLVGKSPLRVPWARGVQPRRGRLAPEVEAPTGLEAGN